ncbi:uncharacterized protein LOC126976882 [Leptidea sinapis]|uniref:uncharacterized protein LOC126976882 n=1 Tax=Leptidea sinapis TaxID=189913 RepID=UPI0021C328F3|nr:uncharacterized protein LOC126976882 [Leptidea sinapis]
MLTRIVLLTVFFINCRSEMTAAGIDRYVSEGVQSIGYHVVYGDEDLAVINEVVSTDDKMNALKSKIDLNEAMPPLPAADVKCLMSVDKYCSKPMRETKNILISALKDECAKCTAEQRESAGKVVASMMAHDPVAWKMFLTRSTLQILPPKTPPKQERHRYRKIGEEKIIENSRNRYSLPGVKIRVKRYVVEKIN